ncbi:MAG: polymerase, sigma-24 subunit, subfamily [Verrucomicrobiales bacterium]|nr:polymerase, sigma-24 subunit, subfamily [Verrucomicrobiales bacterium]
MDKLRRFFFKRGVALSALTLVGVLSANVVQGAPAALVSSVAATGLLNGTASTPALIQTTLQVIGWAKLKTALLAGSAVFCVTGIVAITALQLLAQSQPAVSGLRLKLPVGTHAESLGSFYKRPRLKNVDMESFHPWLTFTKPKK